MGGEKHRRLLSDRRENIQYLLSTYRIESRSRLVADQKLWGVQKSLGDTKPLFHPTGVGVDMFLTVCKTYKIQKIQDAPSDI